VSKIQESAARCSSANYKSFVDFEKKNPQLIYFNKVLRLYESADGIRKREKDIIELEKRAKRLLENNNHFNSLNVRLKQIIKESKARIKNMKNDIQESKKEINAIHYELKTVEAKGYTNIKKKHQELNQRLLTETRALKDRNLKQVDLKIKRAKRVADGEYKKVEYYKNLRTHYKEQYFTDKDTYYNLNTAEKELITLIKRIELGKERLLKIEPIQTGVKITTDKDSLVLYCVKTKMKVSGKDATLEKLICLLNIVRGQISSFKLGRKVDVYG
jgi:hypothetical protein